MIPTKEVNIYALINPINDHVFYIGCSEKIYTRYKEHLYNEEANDKKTEIIKQITAAGKNPKLLLLEKVDLRDASFWEEFYIDLFKSYGYELTNKINKSTYTASYANKYILKSRDTSIPISYNNMSELQDLSRLLGIDIKILIRVAIKEFIKKYLPMWQGTYYDFYKSFDLTQSIYEENYSKK